MPTYVVLGNLTREGMEGIEESPQRLEQVKELTAELGGEFHDFYSNNRTDVHTDRTGAVRSGVH